MISLGLMARLVLALKPSARLILVGDRNQLSSVEPGHVMGDICGSMSEPRYSPRTCGIVRAVTGFELPQGSPTGVADSLVELTHAHRFRPDSGIRYLAEAVRAGDGEACAAFVGSGGSPDVLVRPFEGPEGFDRDLERSVLDGYAPYLEDGLDAGERFARFGLFRVLCALREGRHGVAGVNALAEKVLKARGLVRPHGPHYHGRPVLVTANDYTLGLFNGDIGMVLRDGDGELKCFFPAQGGGLRRISVSRLPEHETAYAMTVHKSQGSEFSRVVLVLPTREMPVLTRELVYTGVTRARDVLELMAAPEVFSAAVRKRTERVSGLGDLLAEVEKINEREDAAR
jgi:exodeoxyribonuclease V alpha subunit